MPCAGISRDGVTSHELAMELNDKLVQFLWGQRDHLPADVRENLDVNLCTVETLRLGTVMLPGLLV